MLYVKKGVRNSHWQGKVYRRYTGWKSRGHRDSLTVRSLLNMAKMVDKQGLAKEGQIKDHLRYGEASKRAHVFPRSALRKEIWFVKFKIGT